MKNSERLDYKVLKIVTLLKIKLEKSKIKTQEEPTNDVFEKINRPVVITIIFYFL